MLFPTDARRVQRLKPCLRRIDLDLSPEVVVGPEIVVGLEFGLVDGHGIVACRLDEVGLPLAQILEDLTDDAAGAFELGIGEPVLQDCAKVQDGRLGLSRLEIAVVGRDAVTIFSNGSPKFSIFSSRIR